MNLDLHWVLHLNCGLTITSAPPLSYRFRDFFFLSLPCPERGIPYWSGVTKPSFRACHDLFNSLQFLPQVESAIGIVCWDGDLPNALMIRDSYQLQLLSKSLTVSVPFVPWADHSEESNKPLCHHNTWKVNHCKKRSFFFMPRLH